MKESGSSKKTCLALQRALIHCQEIGDEKIALVQLVTDLIENRSRQLDQDREHLGNGELIIVLLMLFSVSEFQNVFLYAISVCCEFKNKNKFFFLLQFHAGSIV